MESIETAERSQEMVLSIPSPRHANHIHHGAYRGLLGVDVEPDDAAICPYPQCPGKRLIAIRFDDIQRTGLY